MNTLIFIHSLFAAFAALFGLSSRNFATALVTGFFIGIIHAGIVALHGAQTGTMPISDLAYVQEALDLVISTGHLTFGNARYVTYLAGGAAMLMVITVVCYLARRVVCRIACRLMPKQAAT